MANYKIIIQYDGTRYKGWQRQKTTDQTIQGKIEAILSRQYGRTIEIDGSGRTDAGVHAHGQVANFRLSDACCAGKTPEELCEELRQIFVQYLPEDIAVTEVRAASERFHSRLNVVKKTYVYRIWNADYPNVFERKYMLHDNRPMDVEAMRQAAQYLLGKHDFAAFCGNAKMKKSTVRTIYSLDIATMGPELRFTLRGDGFLYNMVRILVGTLLEVGMGRRSPAEIPGILEARNRETAGYTVPAHGLFLMEVEYP